MRVQCDVCENQLARVLCSADEAALCDDCDAAVHAANKLANKHQRVAILQGEPQLAQERPSCDICQVWLPLSYFGRETRRRAFRLFSFYPTRRSAFFPYVAIGKEPWVR